MCRFERARRGQARGLRSPRLDVQLARPRRPSPLGGAERRRGRLRLARPRRVLLLEGPRRARALRGAQCARRDPDGAPAAAASARRARRPPGRRRARDRGELGLARDGDLEGARDRLGEAPPRSRRPRRRDDRATASCRKARTGRRCRPPRTSGSGGCSSSSTGTSSSRTGRRRRSSRSRASRRSSAAFGCRVVACDGHDHAALRSAFRALWERRRRHPGRPDRADDQGQGRLVHGAPRRAPRRWRHVPLARRRPRRRDVRDGRRASSRNGFERDADAAGLETARHRGRASARGRGGTSLQGEPESGAGAPKPRPPCDASEYVAAAYGEALLELAAREPRLVVLDADLASDCRVRAFELAEPDRFVENGIAEQDMVSMAAGMARHGLVPVVNSFASFLASRANEQIYNQASERTKVVYAMHYAGLIPAGPGKSHQSLRDASLMAAIPGVTVVHPCNAEETRARRRVGRARGGRERRDPPRDRAVAPADRAARRVSARRRRRRRRSGRAPTRSLVSYGPVMLHEALTAAELLAERGIEAAVVAMPWLDRVDPDWLAETFAGVRDVLVVEDHAPVGALGDTLRRALAALPEPPALQVAGVEGWPACGTPTEALRHHGLDGASLAERVALAAAGSRRDVTTARPVWVVVADPLTARVFFDCGIVERLAERLGGRLHASRSASRATRRGVGRACARRRRASSTRTTSIRSPSPPPERVRAPRRSLARRADRLLPARDPPQPAPRLPPRADAARATATTCSTRRGSGRCRVRPADRAGDAPLALLAAAPRRERAPAAARGRAARRRPLEPADAVGDAVHRARPPARPDDRRLRRELGPHRREGRDLERARRGYVVQNERMRDDLVRYHDVPTPSGSP